MSAVPRPDGAISENQLDTMLTAGMKRVIQPFYLTLVCPLNRSYDLVIHTGSPQDPMLRLKLADDGDVSSAFACIERMYAYETPEVKAMTRRVVPTMRERMASILLVVEQTPRGTFLVTDVHEHVKSLWP